MIVASLRDDPSADCRAASGGAAGAEYAVARDPKAVWAREQRAGGGVLWVLTGVCG